MSATALAEHSSFEAEAGLSMDGYGSPRYWLWLSMLAIRAFSSSYNVVQHSTSDVGGRSYSALCCKTGLFSSSYNAVQQGASRLG